VWAVIAIIWNLLAFVDPSSFHTTMAVVWSILAAVQIGSIAYTRRRAQAAAAGQEASRDSATH